MHEEGTGMKNKLKSIDKDFAISIVSLLVAVASILFALQSNQRAEEANAIAREANTIAREANKLTEVDLSSNLVTLQGSGLDALYTHACTAKSGEKYLYSTTELYINLYNSGGRPASVVSAAMASE